MILITLAIDTNFDQFRWIRQKKHLGTDFNWYINWYYHVASITVWIFNQVPQRSLPRWDDARAPIWSEEKCSGRRERGLARILTQRRIRRSKGLSGTNFETPHQSRDLLMGEICWDLRKLKINSIWALNLLNTYLNWI
jgi:hypothetical protein